MAYDYKSAINNFRNRISRWIIKNWFLLNLIFIVAYSLYIISKFLYGSRLLHTSEETIIKFSFFWFTVNIIGFAVLIFTLLSDKKLRLRMYSVLIFIGLSVIMVSYIKIVDPDLKWENSDIALGNYLSAKETVKFGPFDLLNTWNERTNPYNHTEINKDFKDSIRVFINKYSLEGLSFNKWKVNLDTNNYNLFYNNRPYMHPPFTALSTGMWLKIFPFGKWSMQIFIMIITFLSVLPVILYLYKKAPENFNKIALVSIVTSPVLFRFHNSSADQISMLLFVIPVFLFFQYQQRNFWISFISGIAYGLCFYTKFNVLFFIGVLLLTLLLYIKSFSFKYFLGFVIGMLLVVIAFTSLGYYFWLTIITGQPFAKLYALNNPVNFVDSITKILYFGPSFLLISAYLLINSDKLEKNYSVFYIPLIVSLFVLMIYLYPYGVWNRYLMQYLPVFSLFIISMDNKLALTKKDLIISAAANFIFLHLNIYF